MCAAAWLTLVIKDDRLVHLWLVMIVTWHLTHPNQRTWITGCHRHCGESQHGVDRMAATCPPHLPFGHSRAACVLVWPRGLGTYASEPALLM